MTQHLNPYQTMPQPGMASPPSPVPAVAAPAPLPVSAPVPAPAPMPGPSVAAPIGAQPAQPHYVPIAPQAAPTQPAAPQAAPVQHQQPPQMQPAPFQSVAPAYAAPAQQQYSYAPTAPTAAMTYDSTHEGGEVALPAISVQAFCERSQTAGAIHETQKDWRMKRANLKIYMGGLPAAIDYYQAEDTPSLVMVESGLRGQELFTQLEQLAAVCSADTKVVIIGASNDIHLYRQLMEKGVSDYIVPPFHPLTVIRSISALYSDPDQPFTGRVVAFYGAKGGVGSSTMAHNIAWSLAEGIGQETSLIDLDMSWGTTGLDFAYDAVEGLEEALANPDRLDETLLDRIMVRHTDRLSILPASGSLDHSPITEAAPFNVIVEAIRKISSLSILDMPHYWSEWTMDVLNSADDIVITATPDLANLRNTKNLVDYLRSKRPNDALPLLILNMTGQSKRAEISVKDFSAAIGLEPALVVGFDPDTFFTAANDGKMLADMKSTEQLVSGLTYLAGRLKTGQFGSPQSVSGKRTGLRGRKSKKASADNGEGGPNKKSLFASLPFGR